MIDTKTRMVALIGHPVGHSLSPAIHNAAFKETGLNYAYLAFDVGNVKPAISAMREMGFAGYSVTAPHKVAVMAHLDKVDRVAEKIGAVNTIVNRGGKLHGYNTDVTGAAEALKQKVEIRGKKAVILGAGGAARAVGFALKEHGASVTVLDLVEEKARKLASDLKCGFSLVGELHSIEADIFVNATPVGMAPHKEKMPVDPKALEREMAVFDVIYNPLKTMLLREAEKKGCTTISGFDMFVSQGAAQFTLWTGQPAPIALMKKAAKRGIGE